MIDENFDLFSANFIDGQYKNFTNLGEMRNSPYMEIAPYIDSEKHFLIYYSDRPGGFGGCKNHRRFKTGLL